MHNAMETFLLTWKQPKAMPTNIRNPTRGLHVQLFIAIAMLQNKTSFFVKICENSKYNVCRENWRLKFHLSPRWRRRCAAAGIIWYLCSGFVLNCWTTYGSCHLCTVTVNERLREEQKRNISTYSLFCKHSRMIPGSTYNVSF